MAFYSPAWKIMSDNGTAFIGANRLLREAWAAIDHARIQDFIAYNEIKWEWLVRSVKRALSVTLKENTPREEILSTLLVEAEHVINSRPATNVSVAHDDEPALTPNHFLLGSTLTLPPPESTDADLSERQGYKKTLRLADHFWGR
jgi:hypothetical protein